MVLKYLLSHFSAQGGEQTQPNNRLCTIKKVPTDSATQPTQPISYKPLKDKKIERVKEYKGGCGKMVVQAVYQASCYRFHTCVWAV